MPWMINEGVSWLSSGEPPQRRGNAHPNIVPYDAFAGSDGHFLLAVGNDAQFARYADVIGRPDLPQDPRFTTNLNRIENREGLMAEIVPAMKAMTVADILDGLTAAKVPCGPIHTVDQALTSDQAKARGVVLEMSRDDIENGLLRLLANPLKFSATPVRYDRPPPRFGEDTEEVLQTWGPDAELSG